MAEIRIREAYQSLQILGLYNFFGGKNGNISHNYSGTSFIPNKLQLITSLSGYKKLMVRLGLKTMHPVCVANIVLTLAHRCAMIKKSSIAITT